MSVIVILIIFSLLVALVFLAAFIWAAKTGQFDDTHGPSVRVLIENDLKSKEVKGASPENVENNTAHRKRTAEGKSRAE